tara:strand:+ start:68835 stop:69365 length:531 start_codon:yes stop_codon:yes gene_type:complete
MKNIFSLFCLIILFSCSKEVPDSKKLTFFDNYSNIIWYAEFNYDLNQTEHEFIQFTNDMISGGSTFINVCEIISDKPRNLSLNWGDNFSFFENYCENYNVKLVENSPNKLIYRASYFTGEIQENNCINLVLQNLNQNPQRVTWTVNEDVLSVSHENEDSIETFFIQVENFDSACFN